MARAKCKYCNDWINTSVAYKDVVDGKNVYYCSENHHDLHKRKLAENTTANTEYDEIIASTKEIFGYDFTSYSLLRKEINAWEKLTTRKNIISYLKENKEWLSRVMSKEFTSDFHRIRYFSAVISNKLHDYKPAPTVQEMPQITIDNTMYESPKHSLNKRRSLAELEDMF